MTELLRNQAPLPPTFTVGSIITRAEFEQRGQQPYGSFPMQGVANLDALAMDRWGNAYASRGYMHVTDHLAAWEVVHPGIVPKWFDIEDSHNGGSALIEAARRISTSGSTPDSLYGCLVVKLGIGNGSKVYERIMAGERTLVKGSYAGLPYDCSAYPIPGGASPPVTPPVEPPIPPPVPPLPAMPLPFEIRQALVDALARTWTLRYKWRAQYQEAIDKLDEYVGQ